MGRLSLTFFEFGHVEDCRRRFPTDHGTNCPGGCPYLSCARSDLAHSDSVRVTWTGWVESADFV